MKASLALFALAVPGLVFGQEAGVQSLFEAGKHQQVIEVVSGMQSPDPSAVYIAGLAAQKASSGERARAFFAQLAGRPEGDAWHFVGESALRLAEGNVDAALQASTQGVASNGNLAAARYQLGLVYGQKQDFANAAAAFEKAASLDPGFAYAHYHAGISYYKARRVDLMASHFETFLRLAPQSPERPEVESIMRTVRGR